jgi:arylsulfatase A-like enzyme
VTVPTSRPLGRSLLYVLALLVGCAPERPPNVVIILTDDQGYADVGYQEAVGFETPSIDLLAREGTRFTSFYAVESACSPSRASILTGRYPLRVGIPNVLSPASRIGLNPNEVTLAEVLRENGYATAAVGKWHLGHHPKFLPTNHGFDSYFGIPYSNDMSPVVANNARDRARRWPALPLMRDTTVIEVEPDQRQLIGRYTGEALAFIRENANRPFFLYFAHTFPHVPLWPSEEFEGTSDAGTYGDQIQEIDASVGRVMAELGRLGLDENTIVVFTSDNGPWLVMGNHAGSAMPFREGKATAFEGGHRVPTVVRWTGRVPAGRAIGEWASGLDLLPTIASLTGSAVPDLLIDGRDISPWLLGGEAVDFGSFNFYRGGQLHAVREGRWKLHVPHGYPTLENGEAGVDGIPGRYVSAVIDTVLYDLQSDPGERVDLRREEPGITARMLALVDSARHDIGDRLAGMEGRRADPPGRLDDDYPPPAPNLGIGAGDAIYATYAAARERSTFVLDEGYEWVFYDDARAPDFTTDTAGDLGLRLKIDGSDRSLVGSFAEPIAISESYGDLVRYSYHPATGIRVNATFWVHSSRDAIWDVRVTNTSGSEKQIEVGAQVEGEIRLVPEAARTDQASVMFEHTEEPDSWTLDHDMPHVAEVRNLLSVRTLGGVMPEWSAGDGAQLTARASLPPGGYMAFRIHRLVQPAADPPEALLAHADSLAALSMARSLEKNRTRMEHLDLGRFAERDDRLLYLSAANMMEQVFYPPEGRSSYPYYVFSREPTWGWGHGGQVFHESLTMIALARINPELALASQYVYRERQHDNGYINYRTGGHLDEVILYQDTLTSSAPWYAYTNAELYRITRDQEFLERMYPSSRRFYEYFTGSRDQDGDGLAEWGGHAVLESVRDGLVAVWDEVGWPGNFEGIDINSMLVMEEKSLAYMADALGLSEEAAAWEAAAKRRSDLVNADLWDDDTGFYYHVDRRDNDFTFNDADDLKRREIVGFLPLWAGIADSSQAARLVAHLTDRDSFWRPNGIPTLAADDPYYDPSGYWNGPVWIQWNYLIWRGLHDYGYKGVAAQLRDRNKGIIIDRLKAEHNFFELYSPDTRWAGHHRTYIWAGIILGMMD